jgi:hypothetical protein
MGIEVMSPVCDSPLQAAKERLLIPALWTILGLPGRPARSCSSPFREDRNPSFAIYDEGRRWKDYATGQGGDAADFVAMACNLSPEDACRKLIELAGGISQIPQIPREERHGGSAEDEKALQREGWPVFKAPTEPEIIAVAELRGLSYEGVSLAAERSLLYCADSREGRAWIITDSRRRNAQARRLDGQPWARIGTALWSAQLIAAGAEVPEKEKGHRATGGHSGNRSSRRTIFVPGPRGNMGP